MLSHYSDIFKETMFSQRRDKISILLFFLEMRDSDNASVKYLISVNHSLKLLSGFCILSRYC